MDINPKVQYIRLIYCPDHQDIKENELADSLAKTVLKKAKHLQPTTQLSPSEIQQGTYRSSQIACTVTTMHVTCMQTVLRIHRNLCMLLIPLSKDNLNLLSFFLLCACCLLLLSIMVSYLLPCYAALIFLFVCFHRS